MTQHCQVCPIALEKCVDDMLQDLRDMEFYCAEYAAKEQPHIEGLLQVLHNGVGHLEVDIAKLRASGQNVTLHEQARRVLHRLVSCTNRRMHKGFPEMVSYILGKPHFMCSHDFVTVPFGSQFTHLMQELHRGMGLSTGPDEVQASLLEVAGTLDDGLGPSSQATCAGSMKKTQTEPFDYHWRHSTLESWPWYFFQAGTAPEAVHKKNQTLPWLEIREAGILQKNGYHPCRRPEPCQHADGTPLRHPDYHAEELIPEGCQYQYDHYLRVRTEDAWMVPELIGRWPQCPAEDGSLKEKAYFSLFCLFLFKPWIRVSICGAPVSRPPKIYRYTRIYTKPLKSSQNTEQ